MYSGASQGLIDKILSNGGTYLVRIRENGSTKDVTVRSLKYQGGTNAGNYISLGSAICASAEMTIVKPSFTMQGHEYEISFGMEVDGTPEWIPLGLFTAEKPVDDGEDVTVTMYDRMRKFEKPYFSSIGYPAKVVEVLSEISSQCGVPYRAPTGGNQLEVNAKPEGYTCREMLVYIGQILGCFAVIDREGYLAFKWYSFNSVYIGSSRYWDPFERAEADYRINKMTAYIGKEQNSSGETVDKTITKGSGVKGIAFENPFYTDAIASTVWNKINGFTYRPASVEAAGDPRIDPGDIIAIYPRGQNYTFGVPVMTLTFEYDGGLTMKIEAVGDEEQPDDFSVKGPSTQKMERMAAELVLAERILANKVDVDTLTAALANIETLYARKATVEQLEADYLEADRAIVTDLTAAEADIGDLQAAVAEINTAHIDVLESNFARIATLVTGNSSVTSESVIQLTAQNTTMDMALIKDVIAANITVNDLLAGTIYTNKHTVMSQDGAMVMTGSLLTFKDADGNVRIQIGKDGQGNYNYCLVNANGDIAWDAAGITEAGVPNGLIVDDMVADSGDGYNGISASKLDIHSMIGAVNEEGGLKSTAIEIDEEGQTLHVAFNNLKSNVDNLSIGGRNFVLKSDEVHERAATNADGSDGYTAYTTYWTLSDYGADLMMDDTETQFTISYDYEVTGWTSEFNRAYLYSQIAQGNNNNPSSIGGSHFMRDGTSGHHSHTFKQSAAMAAYDGRRVRMRLRFADKNAVLKVWNVKIEKGNRATDWTPAPEDLENYTSEKFTELNVSLGQIESRVGSVETTQTAQGSTIASHSTQIQQTQDKISAVITDAQIADLPSGTTMYNKLATVETTVDGITTTLSNVYTKGDVDGKITDVNSRFATYQQTIDGQVTTISSTVAKLKVGGRNLIKNTLYPDVSTAANYPRLVGQTANTSVSEGTKTVAEHGIRFTNTGATRTLIRFGKGTVSAGTMNGLTAGETYTLSFDASWKLMSGTQNETTYALRAYLYIIKEGAKSWTNADYKDVGIITVADKGTEMSGRCEFTFTIPDEAIKVYLSVAANNSNTGHYAAGDYIELRNLKLEKSTKTSDWTPAPEDYDAALTNLTQSLTAAIEDVQDQIDGVVDTYYYDYIPTLTNVPASGWTTADYPSHKGDMFLDTSTGKSYRFLQNETTQAWEWVEIPDTASAAALIAAQNAQATADGKVRVFTSQPTPPYDEGDLWFVGTSGDILTCMISRSSAESYAATDWQKRNKYTDDTAVNNLAISGRNLAAMTEWIAYNSTVTRGTGSDKWKLTVACNATNYTGIRLASANFEADETYCVSFKVKKTAGTLVNVAYAPEGFTLVKFTVDGTAATNPQELTDDETEHKVVIILKRNANGTASQHFYIQLNRAVTTAVTAEFWDLMVEHATLPSEWEPAPEDIDSDLYDVTTKYNTIHDTVDSHTQEIGIITANYATKSFVTQTANEISLAVNSKASKTDTVASVTIEYALGNDSSTAPSTGWSTSSPKWTEGKYIWQRTKIQKADGTDPTYSNVTCIQGAKGQDGEDGQDGQNGQNGKDGVGISSVTVTYGVSNSASETPTSWQSTVPTVAAGKFLWTRTIVDYTDSSVGDTVQYTYAKQGENGQQGTAGTSVTVSSIQYQEGSSATTAPTGTWSNSPVTVAEGKFLWTKTTFSDGNVAYGVAKQGVSGTNGVNAATVLLYKRATAAPAKPTGTLTYTFATGKLSGTSSYFNGWSQTFPTGDNPCYVILATASSNAATDTIAKTEWSEPVQLVANGTKGSDGLDGTSRVLIQLYQRVASIPSKPSSTLTYSFATNSLSGNTGNWSLNIPESSNAPCYAITASAITTSDTATIPSTAWSEPVIVVENGKDGVGVSKLVSEYCLSSSKDEPVGNWDTTMPKWESGKYLWTRTRVVYTEGADGYTEPKLEQINPEIEARLTEAEHKILDDSIISVVKTYTAFSNRNFLRNSTGQHGNTDRWRPTTTVTPETFEIKAHYDNGYPSVSKWTLIVENKTTTSRYINSDNLDSLKQGGKYVFSFRYLQQSKVNKGSSVVKLYYRYGNSGSYSYSTVLLSEFANDGAWHTVTKDIAIPDKGTDLEVQAYIRIYCGGLASSSAADNKYLYLCDMMFAEGSSDDPPKWEPHPMDSGDYTESRITQTSDMIRLEAKTLVWSADNSSLTQDGTLTVNKATIGGIHIVSNAIYSGSHKVYNSANQGFYLGSDGKFGIGNSTNYMRWDGSTMSVNGTITSTDGTIGGWTINANSIESKRTVNGIQYSGALLINTGTVISGELQDSLMQIQAKLDGTNWYAISQLRYDGSFISRGQNRGTDVFVPQVTDYMKLNAGVLESSGGRKNLKLRAHVDNEDEIISSASDVRHEMGSTTIYGNLDVTGNLVVRGTKPAYRKTANYGWQTVYCYETPTPLFGDAGDGTLDEEGLCMIAIDDILSELSSTVSYFVFLQKNGDGDCWVKERNPSYFVVEGTPGLSFSWELKAKQAGYEHLRYTDPTIEGRIVGFMEPSYEEAAYIDYGAEISEMEDMIYA